MERDRKRAIMEPRSRNVEKAAAAERACGAFRKSGDTIRGKEEML